ncbi:hypothetical protein M095_3038 [Parabacteroides distasonis str. 3999B T(B) 4]|nr:hypothetical protein M095_3038 [Parabacteroides distasonis str. 3999B T(B) 4]
MTLNVIACLPQALAQAIHPVHCSSVHNVGITLFSMNRFIYEKC